MAFGRLVHLHVLQGKAELGVEVGELGTQAESGAWYRAEPASIPVPQLEEPCDRGGRGIAPRWARTRSTPLPCRRDRRRGIPAPDCQAHPEWPSSPAGP